MLGSKNATAVLAVKDLEAAKKFYQGMLGLQSVSSGDPGGQLYKSGESMVFLYPSQFAGTNQATAVTWAVGSDFDAVINDLSSKGVQFEHYDIPGVTHDGDVHKINNLSSVWFKDPDGNILNVIDQM